MTRDKITLYALAAAVSVGLIPILFLGRDLCRPLAALWLLAAAVAICLLVRKRRVPSLDRRAVLLVTVAFVLLYLTLFYLSGLSFGFVKRIPALTAALFVRRLLPSAVIIVASEAVRRILLAQEHRASAVLAFLCGLLGEIAIAGGLSALSGLDAMMDTIGLSLLPAVSSGILCQFVAARHGALPTSVYRLLMTLTPFFIPVAPAIPEALNALAGLLVPLFLLLFLRALFEKKKKRAIVSRHAKRLGIALSVLGLFLAIGLVAVISGKFRYSTVVIATGSMTGELNVGDAVVYERYEGQDISEGEVIVFKRNSTLVVHRVVEIEHINGVTRYYTKGDANESRDIGFSTSADIVGITKFKISYAGYLSLLLHRAFED